MQITLFYDGHCPLCVAEMNALRRHDHDQQLNLVDIQRPEFKQSYPDLDWDALNARIHARLPDGRMVQGVDATYLAWKQVGKGWLYAPLRWPVINKVADLFYDLFARHRYTLSYWLTGKRRGPQCTYEPKRHD